MSERNNDEFYEEVNKVRKKNPKLSRREAERKAFPILNKEARDYAKKGSKRAIDLGTKNPDKYPKNFKSDAELDLAEHEDFERREKQGKRRWEKTRKMLSGDK